MKATIRIIAFQGVTYGLQVIFMLMAARYLGIEGQGKYALFRTSVYLLEAFMWFGLTNGISYFIAKNSDKYHDILLSLCLTYLCSFSVLAYVGFTLAHPYVALDINIGYLLIGWVVLLALGQILQKVFLGRRQYDFYNYTNLIGVFVLFASLFAYASTGSVRLEDVIKCNIWGALGSFILAIILHGKYLRTMKFILAPPRVVVSELYSVGLLGYFSSVAFLVLYRIDFFLVGYFLSARQLGIYTVAVLILEAFQKIPDWLGMILAPKVASGGDEAGLLTRQYAIFSLLLIGLFGIVLWGMQASNVDVLKVTLGEDYGGVQRVVLWMVPRAMLHGVMAAYAGNLAGRGYSLYHPAAGVVAAIMLAVLDSTLIPTWGLSGAVIGITSAYVAATFIMMLGFRRHTVPAATPGVGQVYVS